MKRVIFFIIIFCCVCSLAFSARVDVGGGGGGSSSLTADSVGTSELDDGSDTPVVDYCVRVDSSDTTKFQYTVCPGASGGDSVTIDGAAITDPDFISTGLIDFIKTGNDVTAGLNWDDLDPINTTTIDADWTVMVNDPANPTVTIGFNWDDFYVEMATDGEATWENLLDLQDLQGAVTDGQVPDGITVNLSATATALATARAIYGNNFDGTSALTQVIASTYGGTGNGFTKFSGATTSEKTYTLPDSSVTLLYSGGALGTPSSGVASNLTALNATQLTTGTVPVARVGAAHIDAITEIASALKDGTGACSSGLLCLGGHTHAVGSEVSGLGTSVATALAVNVGSAGAFVVNGGALGTPSSGVGTNLTALNGENIQDDTIDEDSIDFGTSTDQVSASDMPDEDLGDISVSSGAWTLDNSPASTVLICSSTTSMTGCDYTCDGTDDDVQIQAAHDNLDGGRILFSEGQFNFGATVTISKVFFLFEGMGAETVFRMQDSTNVDMFETDVDAVTNGIVFKRFYAQGNKSNNTSGGFFNNGAGLSYISDVILEDVFIWDFPDDAITTSQAWGFVCKECIIEQNDGWGIVVSGGDEYKIVNSHITENGLGAINTDAIRGKIIGNFLEGGAGNPAILDTGGLNVIVGNTFKDRAGETDNRGVEISAATSSIVSNNIFYSTDDMTYGIVLTNGDYNSITGNIFAGDSFTHTIIADSSSANNFIAHNNYIITAGAVFSDAGTDNIFVGRADVIAEGSTPDYRIGDLSNYMNIDDNGDMSFLGTADYLVGSNDYAFRYSGDEDAGLIFNTDNGRYDFTDTNGDVVGGFGATNSVNDFLLMVNGSIQLGSMTTASASCISVDSDRPYADKDCDNTKDAGEEYLDASGGAESNDLETTITGIADTEIFIGNGADSGTYASMSGDATLSNTGVLAIGNDKIDSQHYVANSIDDEHLNITEWMDISPASAKITGTFITSGALIDGSGANKKVLFAGDSTQSAVYQFRMPSTYGSSPILKILYSMSGNCSSTKVDMEAEIMAVTPDSDAIDIETASFDTLNEITGGTSCPATAGYLGAISITLTNADSVAAGDLVYLRINRDHDDADDTESTASLELVGLTLEWTR